MMLYLNAPLLHQSFCVDAIQNSLGKWTSFSFNPEEVEIFPSSKPGSGEEEGDEGHVPPRVQELIQGQEPTQYRLREQC